LTGARDQVDPHKSATSNEAVRQLFERLPRHRWHVLQNHPPGWGPLGARHLVIGDGGVFAINIEEHPAKVTVSGKGLWVDGWRTDEVLHAADEGRRLRTLLSEALGERVPVMPVIVLVCKELRVDSPATDAAVLRRRDLIKWLEAHPAAMPLTRAALIAKTVRDPGFWEKLK
jgi:hypothetical protein